MGKIMMKDKTKDDCLMRLPAAKRSLKIADICIHETPTPIESANVGNGDTHPPLNHADTLMDGLYVDF